MNDKQNSERAEQMVLTFFDQVWTPPHQLGAIDQLMAEDYIIHTAGTTIRGRAEFKTWVQDFHHKLLEAKTESLDVFADAQGEKVVSRWICSGKNNGIFDLEADGRSVMFTGLAIWYLKGDRFKECWVERSAFELYRSLVG
ncbi:MAG: ester cyclase [Bacteroidota bacterium]